MSDDHRDGDEEREPRPSEVEETIGSDFADDVAPPSPEVGRPFGRYRVTRVLGKGAVGAVYLGYDEQLDREVAIKVPRFERWSEKLKTNFLKEARQLAKLRHPGIVTVHDVGVSEDQCFIVSSYLAGQTLHDWLASQRPSWIESVEIAAQLADALAHAHALRTVHRDLKPANVILVEGRRPVIVDFGLAVSDASAARGRRGVVVGTPAYMSPEQASGEGHRIDGRTDIYSLGAILYRMLTGRSPFHAKSAREMMRQVRDDEPQPPRQLAPDLPRELETICLKAMAKAIGDRYTTASDLAEELRRVAAAQSPRKSSADPEPTLVPDVSRNSELETSLVRQRRAAARRRVTVLQIGCDLFESEQVMESLDPEAQQEALLEFQGLCRSVTGKFGGAVVHPTDRGLLVCFGFPLAHEDAAERAVRAALALLAEIPVFASNASSSGEFDLGVTAAIHSGPAVVEDKGGEGETLSVVGQVVGIVGRLEMQAEPSTVLISGDIEPLVRRQFSCESAGELRAARQRIPLFRVTAALESGDSFDGVRETELTPLTGREREVGLLEHLWRQATEGVAQVVLLTGEAGLGKSRLVHVLKEQAAQEGVGATVVDWRCTPHSQGSALYPIIEGFSTLLASAEAETGGLDRLVGHLRSLELDGEEEIGLLASLLSVPLEGCYPELELDARRKKEKTLDLLLDWLGATADRGPLLLVVEDLHWVDPTTAEFLQVLVDQSLDSPLLVLLTYRPDFEPQWRHRAHHTQIALNRLTRTEICEMMVRKSGLQEIPPAVVDLMAERTDGVPLFVEEFTSMVLAAGGLVESDAGSDTTATFPEHEIPATLQDLVMARLDQTAGDLDVVQLASTIGREFSFELIEAVSELEGDALRDELAGLVDNGLLFLRGRGSRAKYRFKHALIQDAAYQSMLKKKREDFHRRLGETIESRFPEAVKGQPELLAHHFTQANRVEKAADYWNEAGRWALDRFAHKEAVQHLTRGLELLKQVPESRDRDRREAEMLSRLGVPLQSTRGYGAPEVLRTYQRARELCLQLGDNTKLFSVLCGLFRAHMLQAHYARASERAKELIALAEESGDAGFAVTAHRSYGAVEFYLGRHREAIDHLERVISIETTPELRRELSRFDVVDPHVACLSYRAWSLWLTGFPDRARTDSEAAVATARERDQSFTLALALSFASWLHQFSGDAALTREAADQALELSHTHGFAFWLGWGRILRAWTLAETGDLDSAVDEMRAGLDEWRAQGSELGRSYFLALLAEVLIRAGRTDEAEQVLSEAVLFTNATGERFWASELERLRGELGLARGRDRKEVDACFLRAAGIAKEQGARSLELRAAMALAAEGAEAEAYSSLEEVYEGFDEGFESIDLRRAKDLLDAHPS